MFGRIGKAISLFFESRCGTKVQNYLGDVFLLLNKFRACLGLARPNRARTNNFGPQWVVWAQCIRAGPWAYFFRISCVFVGYLWFSLDIIYLLWISLICIGYNWFSLDIIDFDSRTLISPSEGDTVNFLVRVSTDVSRALFRSQQCCIVNKKWDCVHRCDQI